jgi:hypothetical protein
MELLSETERNWCDLGHSIAPCPSTQTERPKTRHTKYEADRRTEKLRVGRASGVLCPCEIHRGSVAAADQHTHTFALRWLVAPRQ